MTRRPVVSRIPVSALVSAAVLCLVGCAALAGCGSAPAQGPAHPGQAAAPKGEHVDGSKAKKLVAGGARLVDVRGADEYGAKHIEGAENAPVETIEDRDMGAKDTALVLYCSSGARSARAAASLRAKGYTQVYELGAMSNWDK
ncbi:MAG: Rhodanese-like protein [Labilithrix sp.]|nr:Rhodanese-like protein [Labilithrix sp.]